MKSVTVNQETAARAFVAQLNKGVIAWAEAGKILVRMLDADIGAFGRIRAIAPHISMDVLVAFEKIGRNKIYPYLLLDNSPGMKRLAQLPYTDQERYYQEKVKVVIGMARGLVTTVVEKAIGELTAQQAELVISCNGIRTVQEQGKLFEEKRAESNGKRAMVRGHTGHKSEEISKFISLGCFRLSVSKVDGKPCLLKSHQVNGVATIEIKTSSQSGVGSDAFEILVDKTLATTDAEDIPDAEPGLNSAVQNQIEELIRRRAALTATLRERPEKKMDAEKAIKEINRKISSLESIA